ncbi:hypothetical protein ABIC71_003055 [Herbaspirillum seropedicae]|uniref:hypothetical protein n=1 Tax=Herbaspirillum seropedicae TaxID=964 RepID=UPI00339631C2
MLEKKSAGLVPAQKQIELFHVEKQIEIDGIEMGVLENGIPYLTESGLARMCGVDRKVLNRLAANWSDEQSKPRGKVITQLLEQSNYSEESLFLRSEHNGSPINAYTEPVCLAMLEYYAFMAEETREQAVNAFRALARTTFRTFIYGAVGYNPEQQMLDRWKHFHDRVDINLDSVPDGYYSIFKEIAGMIVTLIRAEVAISDKVIPDLSVGKTWSSYWKDNDLTDRFGERVKYEHNYPEYYAQALSNPQEAWAYPDSSLPMFRSWFKSEYIANKFPSYMLRQTSQGKIGSNVARQALEALTSNRLGMNSKNFLTDK